MRLGIPYVDGGLRDQPIRMYRRMKIVLNVYEAMVQWKYKPSYSDPSQESDWYKTHDHVLKIVDLVQVLREEKEKNV